MAASYQLKLNDRAGNSRDFDFDKRKVVIGRDPSGDVVIDDIEISRRHLIITREKGAFYAEDQGSTNGTFLGKRRLAGKTEIKNGEILTLGQDHTIEFIINLPELKTETGMVVEAEAAPEEVEGEEALMEDMEWADEPVPAEEESVEEILPVQGDVKVKEKAPKVKKKRPTWLVILLAALAFIVVFCVIPLIVIEVTNQWCDLFAGFFNSMSPGVCP